MGYSMDIQYIGIISAIIGFGVSIYLLHRRTSQKKLMCPRKGDCEKVVSSIHGAIFGVHNDVLGAIFYAGMLVLFPLASIDVVARFLLLSGALVGFLYSMYLILVQIVVIRAWCLWCTISALSATVLFFSLF